MAGVKTRRRHVFAEDVAMQDPRTKRQWCRCGLPADNDVHDLPRRSQEERDHEARRMGETVGR